MRVFLVVLTFCLLSCSTPETLRVRQFHLRDTKAASGDLFIRAEMNKRLHGAVSEEARKLRRGNYYHLRWHGLRGEKPLRIIFEYRQTRTGALVRKIEKLLPPSKKGAQELKFIGKEYEKNGRVLAWRATLYEGKERVAKKQSYLWD